MKRPCNITLASLLTVEEENEPKYTKKRRMTIGNKWEVKDLPEMPYLYLKEKTSVVVLNDGAQNIANRIVKAAKDINCIGEYDDGKAKATLTVEDTEMTVQLFKVNSDKNDKLFSCIIVELCRSNGSPIVFHRSARQILSACTLNKGGHKNIKNNSPVPQSTIKMKLGHGSKFRINESDLFHRTVETVDTLLKKDRIDANLLGMESLQLITNTNCSSDATVAFASNVVMNGCHFMDIKPKVIELILNQFKNDVEDDVTEPTYYRKMRVSGLSVLWNALNFTSKNNSINEEYFQGDEWTGEEGLILALLKEVGNAMDSPQEAFLAGKCLLIILKTSAYIRSTASQMEASSIVSQGSSSWDSYLLLKTVALELLTLLEDTK
eukprot:CAMPEP_0176487624 /NCGR_PEP_ID=MMETSP0200_2-20121128/6246_1 /TAXON_ID=947934 /ORGANISM="Chaetoceros sp., Strain GSL56" /LENGTH=378 /DNA_ID=CAMNT_0017884495 /DNA_START=332 /DNA_END=1468 /DNA_ORIENTATION=+